VRKKRKEEGGVRKEIVIKSEVGPFYTHSALSLSSFLFISLPFSFTQIGTSGEDPWVHFDHGFPPAQAM
jgi:hypothetical protein